MTSVVDVLSRAGQGPVRLRAALRTRSHEMRATLVPATALRLAGSRLPEELTGPALLDVFGPALREALDAIGPAREVTAAISARRVTLDPASSPPAARLPWQDPLPADTSKAQHLHGERVGRAASGFAPPPGPLTVTHRGDAASGGAPGAHRPPLDPAGVAGRRSRPASPPPGAGAERHVLAARLMEYRALHAREAVRPPHAAPSPDGPVANAGAETGASVLRTWAGDGYGRAAAPTWPEGAARDAVRTVGDIVTGAAPSHGRSHVVAGAVADRLEIRNVFNVEVRDTSDGEDLAERLAVLLREQALQHGIDVS